MDNIYEGVTYRFQIIETKTNKNRKGPKQKICDKLSWNYQKFAKLTQKFLFSKDSTLKITDVSLE